jgi:GTP-binding protein EngB required for normal cell division
LRDYEGNYEEFLEKNEEEAVVMAAKEDKMREIEKDNIKAKSKMSKVRRPAELTCICQAVAGLPAVTLSSSRSSSEY